MVYNANRFILALNKTGSLLSRLILQRAGLYSGTTWLLTLNLISYGSILR
jgi:hypothetical protein